MNDFPAAQSFINSIVLNSIQKDAVVYNDGPQLVFAGAGTGKTRVLTAKIAFLIKEAGLFPNHIFAATFTNKAASEMRNRIETLVGISCNGLWIGTFHSLCARILRREAQTIGYLPTFTIYDQQDQLSLIKKVMTALHIDERTMQPKQLAKHISRFKNACKPFKEVEGTGASFYEREVIAFYGSYQAELRKAMAMDFDDLVTNTVYLLRKDTLTLDKYRGQFRYVLVDEYQDTNESQFQLVKMLAREHKRIFVVGDDDQSIYSWRGARIENILSFDTVFPGTRVFKLEQNYRSTRPILEFANAVIKGNRNRADKKLWTSEANGKDVVVTRYRDDRQEADGVAEKMQEAMSRGVASGQMAVLFRTNAQSRLFEEVLRRKNIHYILVGGTSFYERKEVKDCLAYLRLLVNPDDTMSCERILNVPARGIGAKTQERLTEMAKAQGTSLFTFIRSGSFGDLGSRTIKGVEDLSSIFTLLSELQEGNAPPPDILSEMLTLTGYIDELENTDTEESRARVENINELLNALTIWHREHPDKTLTDFLEEITLVADIDNWDQKKDAVNLMTLHCAKGLEFEEVYIVGVEDGLLPSRQNFDDEQKIEEECRLFYVGATRAMHKLECSYVNTRMRFGSVMPMEPSRFIEQVPAGMFRHSDQSAFVAKPFVRMPAAQKKEVVATPARQAARPEPVFDDFSQDSVQYRMGQIVMHNKYGQGKIVSISGFGPDMHLTVLFRDGGRKQMMARFANLHTV